MGEPDLPLADPRFGLGLGADANRIAPHNPLWAEAFGLEAARLRRTAGERLLSIDHVGSTAVPGLAAKPILDIQAGVAEIATALELIEPLAAIGYDHAGGQGIPDHHIFGLRQPRLCLVHIVVEGSEAAQRVLRFRDRLRADAALRQAYEALKRRLWAASLPRADYTGGKSDFIDGASAAR